MRSYRKSSHSIHDLKVHLIWITKYRYEVLTHEVGFRIRDLIRQICKANDIHIISGNVSKDHIHLYISYPPKLSVSEIVRRLKGRSSRKIQEEFPQLSKRYWGKHFWGIGYAAFSSGHVTDEMIREYLEHHDKHPYYNDNFVVE
ncbi:transposase [Candidatus Magnetomoraceae bacterium gMMP-15]